MKIDTNGRGCKIKSGLLFSFIFLLLIFLYRFRMIFQLLIGVMHSPYCDLDTNFLLICFHLIVLFHLNFFVFLVTLILLFVNSNS